jgi:hypothetical protein
MLPGGVFCSNDSSSAIGVAVRKSGVNRFILMIGWSSSNQCCCSQYELTES